DLVVIRITPLAALEPYKAEAAPPFNTDMEAMSSGFMSPKPLPISAVGFQKSLLAAPVKLAKGTPSTTIRGWLSPVRELKPLRIIFDEAAGLLLLFMICKPETFPTKAFAMLFSLASTRSLDLISWN